MRSYTLEPQGIVLASLGIIPLVSIQDNKDQTKAGVFATMLAGFQGLWIIVGVIARKLSGLLVTSMP